MFNNNLKNMAKDPLIEAVMKIQDDSEVRRQIGRAHV